MERARAAGLVDPAPVAAVDATGLETRHMSATFGLRRAGQGEGRRARKKEPAKAPEHRRTPALKAPVAGRRRHE